MVLCSNPPSSSTTNKVLGYPLDAWYVAAWDHEVTGKPVARPDVADVPWPCGAPRSASRRFRGRLLGPPGAAVDGQDRRQ